MILDTYGDQQKAYDFVVNPRNVQADGVISQSAGGHTEDISYELVWYSATSINDSSWIVEMAIPFSSILFPDKELTYRGYVLWRGLLHESSLREESPLADEVLRLSYPNKPGHNVIYFVPNKNGSVRKGDRLFNWAAYMAFSQGAPVPHHHYNNTYYNTTTTPSLFLTPLSLPQHH